MVIYVPGTEETDPKKQNMSLQQLASKATSIESSVATNTANIATNTANIATNAANTATNTANISTNAGNISSNTAAISKLANNQFARVYLSANQTGLAATTFTVVNFNTTTVDASSIWDNTNKRFKPTIAGWYYGAWGLVGQSGGGTTVVLSSMFRNGSEYSRGSYTGTSAASSGASTGNDIVYFNGSTDYADVRAYLDGSASRDVVGTLAGTHFSIFMVKAD